MKKALAAMLSATIAFTALAGCGSTKDQNGGSTGGDAKKDPVAVKIFIGENAGKVPYRDDFPIVEELGRRTNTKIEFQVVPSASLKDKFNLAISSGDMPDVMVNLRDDINKFGPTGAFIPLDELMDKYAPNLKAFYESDPSFKKYQRASDGKIYTVPKWMFNRPTTANFMRKDWLDKLNLKVPETVDDFVNVLKAFRDSDPNGNGKKDEIPYSTRGENTLYTMMTFTNPYGVTDDWYSPKFTIENKKIVYGPADSRFKDALTLLNKLYKEGLIDKEFATMDDKAYDAKLSANQIGAVNYWIGYTSEQNTSMKSVIPSFEWVSVPPLKGPGGQQMWNGNDALVTNHNAGITVKNKHPEETIKLIDYMFSDEGVKLLNWGIEGTHYKMENGKPKYTDLILKNAKYPDRTDALQNEGIYLLWPYKYDPSFLDQISEDPLQKQVRDTYNKYMGENLPPLALSQEEKDQVTKIMADITTYKNEMVLKFIMGAESLDKFESYVANIKKMGLDTVLDIYNKAYQKYLQN